MTSITKCVVIAAVLVGLGFWAESASAASLMPGSANRMPYSAQWASWSGSQFGFAASGGFYSGDLGPYRYQRPYYRGYYYRPYYYPRYSRPVVPYYSGY